MVADWKAKNRYISKAPFEAYQSGGVSEKFKLKIPSRQLNIRIQSSEEKIRLKVKIQEAVAGGMWREEKIVVTKSSLISLQENIFGLLDIKCPFIFA